MEQANPNPYATPKAEVLDAVEVGYDKEKALRTYKSMRNWGLTILAAYGLIFVAALLGAKGDAFASLLMILVIVSFVASVAFLVYTGSFGKAIGKSALVWAGLTFLFGPLSFPVAFLLARREGKRAGWL